MKAKELHVQKKQIEDTSWACVSKIVLDNEYILYAESFVSRYGQA